MLPVVTNYMIYILVHNTLLFFSLFHIPVGIKNQQLFHFRWRMHSMTPARHAWHAVVFMILSRKQGKSFTLKICLKWQCAIRAFMLCQYEHYSSCALIPLFHAVLIECVPSRSLSLLPKLGYFAFNIRQLRQLENNQIKDSK